MIKIPFDGYKDFKDCVNKNQDKRNPEAYCAEVERRIKEGIKRWDIHKNKLV